MAVPKPKKGYKYTYADYLSWPDEERWEIIEGVPYPLDFSSEFPDIQGEKLVYNMSPAPGKKHQEILGIIFNELYNNLKGKKCSVFTSPFDVRFPDKAKDSETPQSDELTYTVVQPDLLVVCNREKLDDKGCKGAPDICVEILSPSTSYKDETEKFRLYEKNGVREYWIVNPSLETIAVYTLESSEYGNPVIFKKRDILRSSVLEGLELELARVFSEKEIYKEKMNR